MPKALQELESQSQWTLGEHPALNLLNTLAQVDDTLVDSLQTDADVIRWLANAGWPAEAALSDLKPSTLLESAHSLREIIRRLVERRKAGKRIDPADLNVFLARSRSHLELIPQKKGALGIERRWAQRTPEQVLAPLAEAAAELLAHDDFSLVKHCESSDCVLWFYDRTRSHRRRWCSMATCGNRHKVAAFRSRQAAIAEP